jgi:hypothetical protein
MRRMFLIFLVAFLALPTFVQLVPHDVMHDMHNIQEANHQKTSQVERTHSHRHADTSHNRQDQSNTHHITNFIFFTHFTDLLHVDLEDRVQTVSSSPRYSNQDIDTAYLSNVLIDYDFDLIFIKDPVQPDYHRNSSRSTPLYMTTKRLLI